MTNPSFDLPITGWCSPDIFVALDGLRRCDNPWFTAGPICEIGVFHGKFLVTAHGALGGVKALGIDVFEDVQRNIDGSGVDESGKGLLASFRESVAKHALAPGMVSHWAMDSFDLSVNDVQRVLDVLGTVKLFSIDGGHTAEHVINDMNFAQQVVPQDGIILVDDMHNPHWPGVGEGLAKLYLTGSPKFAPFLFLANKLFLCGLSFHARALASLDQALAPLRDRIEFRPVTMYGHKAMAGIYL